MHWLGGVERENLIDIFQWSPNALGNAKQHWYFLRRPEQMVESSAREGQIDGGGDRGAVAEDLGWLVYADSAKVI